MLRIDDLRYFVHPFETLSIFPLVSFYFLQFAMHRNDCHTPRKYYDLLCHADILKITTTCQIICGVFFLPVFEHPKSKMSKPKDHSFDWWHTILVSKYQTQHLHCVFTGDEQLIKYLSRLFS